MTGWPTKLTRQKTSYGVPGELRSALAIPAWGTRLRTPPPLPAEACRSGELGLVAAAESSLLLWGNHGVSVQARKLTSTQAQELTLKGRFPRCLLLDTGSAIC